VQALQEPEPEDKLEEYVAECHRRMYDQFESDRASIDSHRISDLRFEELVSNPFRSVERLYEELELGDFAEAAEPLRKRLADHDKYQPNKHEISDEQRRRVLAMWPEYCQRYGYSLDPNNEATKSA
jgi:hypothetical protein